MGKVLGSSQAGICFPVDAPHSEGPIACRPNCCVLEEPERCIGRSTLRGGASDEDESPFALRLPLNTAILKAATTRASCFEKMQELLEKRGLQRTRLSLLALSLPGVSELEEQIANLASLLGFAKLLGNDRMPNASTAGIAGAVMPRGVAKTLAEAVMATELAHKNGQRIRGCFNGFLLSVHSLVSCDLLLNVTQLAERTQMRQDEQSPIFPAACFSTFLGSLNKLPKNALPPSETFVSWATNSTANGTLQRVSE